jgi:hypothetical protein
MCRHILQDHIWLCQDKEPGPAVCQPWPPNCGNCGYIRKVDVIDPVHHAVPCSFCVDLSLWVKDKDGNWVRNTPVPGVTPGW